MEKICFCNEGSVYCKSANYMCHDVIQAYMNFEFYKGINKLVGEIDSGFFGISYLISMYDKIGLSKKTFARPLMICVDGHDIPLKDFTKVCCYLDRKYPLFCSSQTVRKLVRKGLKKSSLNYSEDDICDLFGMEKFRFDRPINCVGNERFKAMAAIGFSHGKEVFCFPWLSYIKFESYRNHMPFLLKTLENLGKFAIVPVGADDGSRDAFLRNIMPE